MTLFTWTGWSSSVSSPLDRPFARWIISAPVLTGQLRLACSRSLGLEVHNEIGHNGEIVRRYSDLIHPERSHARAPDPAGGLTPEQRPRYEDMKAVIEKTFTGFKAIGEDGALIGP